MPDCRRTLSEAQTDSDSAVVTGEMAHISGKEPNSPRYISTMSEKERNSYENLILLCGSCHKKIDAQTNKYSVEELHRIKMEHEKWIMEITQRQVPDITFVELRAVVEYIASGQAIESSSYYLVSPKEKIRKNALSASIEGLIRTGISRVKEVERYIDDHPDIEFGERLKTGFAAEYQRQKDAGYAGDDLFMSLLKFAARGNEDTRRTAGLIVLVYLFEACEVFEK